MKLLIEYMNMVKNKKNLMKTRMVSGNKCMSKIKIKRTNYDKYSKLKIYKIANNLKYYFLELIIIL